MPAARVLARVAAAVDGHDKGSVGVEVGPAEADDEVGADEGVRVARDRSSRRERELRQVPMVRGRAERRDREIGRPGAADAFARNGKTTAAISIAVESVRKREVRSRLIHSSLVLAARRNGKCRWISCLTM